MPIPNSQLQTWTNQGSTVNSSRTHTLIRNVLADYDWPEQMDYEDYLQGSYRNATNIRGESDVDIVIECTSVFYNNLTNDEKRLLNFSKSSHTIDRFRAEAVNALEDYFGKKYVDSSRPNAIKVSPDGSGSNRLYADVVICAQYRRYDSLKETARGITFWNQETGDQIINYPKLHFKYGATKNDACSGTYKQTVRMFKNARSYICGDDTKRLKRFASYFVECLIFNVPPQHFRGATWKEDFVSIVNYLNGVLPTDEATKFVTQSRRHWLFNKSQWNKEDAIEFVDALINLWNNWYV
jgi:hypothetical protein